MNRLKTVFISLWVSVLFGIGLSQCKQGGDSAAPMAADEKEELHYLNWHDSVQYVGAETCKGCHSGIHKSFKQTGMGQSFAKASKAKSSANFGTHSLVFDSISNFYYQPFWLGDSLHIREFRLDELGDTIHQRIEKVSYIVGSGQHTNSHIIERNGYLFQAPFTFYTQKGVLDLPPGFEDGNNSRFSRALSMECLSCHNGYPKKVEGSFNKYHDVPQGIDCERCHGPGELHVKNMREGKTVDISKEVDYSIVNPRKLSYERQKDVCQRCHLQGNALLKKGKDWKDFKPGMRLKEVVDVFMPALKDEKGEFIMASHPDRLALSECFLQSQKQSMESMTCITCHNPHQSIQSTKKTYFNETCQGCHNDPQNHELCTASNSSSNCVDCHMKKSSTVDIPHVSVTDHYIRVYEDDEPIKALAGAEQDFLGLRCLTSSNPEPKTMARAYLNFYEKFNRKEAFLDSAKAYLDVDSERKWTDEWIQFYFLKNLQQPLLKLSMDLNHDKLSIESLYRLAEANKMSNPAKSIELMSHAIKLQPLRLEYREKYIEFLLANRQIKEAKKEAEFVLEEDPKNTEALNYLGFCQLSRSYLGAAKNSFLQVLSLDPDHYNASLNLLKVYLIEGNKKEAQKLYNLIEKKFPLSEEARFFAEQIKSMN